MRYRLTLLAVAGLLLCPKAAAAEPITLQPRLVAGDSMHYTEGVHTTVSSDMILGTIDSTLGVSVSVEDVQDDGAASVRETIDQFDVTGDYANSFDPTPWVGAQFTFTIHPDGSTSDFQQLGGDAEDVSIFGAGAGFPALVPPAGLSVGESYDVTEPLPLPLSQGQAELPVHTILDALVTEDDRPSARLIQTLKIPELDVPFGPFGASGTASVRGDGLTIYLLDLDTGWPWKMDGVTAVRVNVALEGKEQAVDERVETHMLMDDQALADE